MFHVFDRGILGPARSQLGALRPYFIAFVSGLSCPRTHLRGRQLSRNRRMVNGTTSTCSLRVEVALSSYINPRSNTKLGLLCPTNTRIPKNRLRQGRQLPVSTSSNN